ncbi:MAG: hypothetical protein AB8B71_20340 [Paracoccaceae bacterium]
MTAIETLSAIIAQRGKASKATYEFKSGFALLAEAGLVRVQGIVQSMLCDACDGPHDAEVIHENGVYGCYCPDAGFVALDDHSSIRAVVPDTEKLVSELANILSCKRRKSTPVQNDTWRVGALDTSGGDLAIYFHPSLQTEQDVRDVNAALAQEVRAAFRLVLTAQGRLTPAGAKSAQLSDIIELIPHTGTLATFADPITMAGAPRHIKNGRPSDYAAKLTAIFLQRIEAGAALSGRNEEARAVADIYRQKHPDETAPSLPTIKRHLTELRAGS